MITNESQMMLTIKLAKGHVELVNIQFAITIGVIVTDHVAQIASCTQFFHVFFFGDLNVRKSLSVLFARRSSNGKIVLLPLK